jgi:DNA-binding MarR family transcriptional regulator
MQTADFRAEFGHTRACHCLAARRTARAITRLFEEYLRPHSLRATQFSALSVLAQRGPTSVSTLADILGLERTTMTRGAALLERNRWVATVPSEDARERLLSITEAGVSTLRAALPAWETAQRIVDEWPGIHHGPDERDAARSRPQADSN